MTDENKTNEAVEKLKIIIYDGSVLNKRLVLSYCLFAITTDLATLGIVFNSRFTQRKSSQ
jgi:hypothetical protein